MKRKIGLLFGGRSAEHDISLISAQSIYKALDQEKNDIFLIYVDPTGKWHDYSHIGIPAHETRKHLEQQQLALMPGENQHFVSTNKNIKELDVIFPVMHGTFGEDGTIQGLLRLLNIPFVGCDILSSSVCMDKEFSKRIFRDHGLPIADFLCYKKGDSIDLSAIEKKLGLPLFVKPANMGSSVGVSKAKNHKELSDAIACAFRYDDKIIIEEMIKGREIEVAVLGNHSPKASEVGEIKPHRDFYDYIAKYEGDEGADLLIPAPLDKETRTQVQEFAIRAFRALSCSGLARIDMFLRQDGKIFINEINTMPGFTKNSMYPNLWKHSGVDYKELIENLLDLAIERHKEQNKLLTEAFKPS